MVFVPECWCCGFPVNNGRCLLGTHKCIFIFGVGLAVAVALAVVVAVEEEDEGSCAYPQTAHEW
jgi:hypothetical protein